MDIQIRLTTKQTQLWRIPHDVERFDMDSKDLRYTGKREGIVRKEIRDAGVARPEVFRAYPDHATRLVAKHQWLWRNINPELSGSRWATLLGNTLAWTNGTGFPGHADYVNNRELDQGLPHFHAVLLCGGAIVEGEEDGNRVWIKSLLISEPVISAEELLSSRMWYWGTSVIPPKGDINIISRLGIDNTYKHVRVPLITTERIWLPKDELHKLDINKPLPSPTWIAG